MAVSGIGVAGAFGAYALAPAIATKSASTIDFRSIALSNASAVSSDRSSARTVTIGNPIAASGIYANLASIDPEKFAWAMPPTDCISQQMGQLLKSADSFSMLSGLGAALLNRFANTQSDFQQSVASYPNPAAMGLVDATAGATALQSAQNVRNSVGLTIHTASGKEVDISITFGGDHQIVQGSLSIDVQASGTLSLSEQTAIAQLSKGFASVLQDIGSGSPQVDVSGLVNFDPTVLSSVDLKVREPQSTSLQSLDFHADAAGRSFSMQGAAGTVSVSVDLSKPALWGSTAEQQTALRSYLDQFDAANQRAHGGATLLGEFKNAFSQLNSSYPVPGPQPAQALPASALNKKDLSVLSGLADFQASMTGESDNGSATHWATEAGRIDYQVSQQTETCGVGKSTGLTVAQTQATTLGASYEQPRDGAMPDMSKGDYDLYRITDSISSTTSFAYADSKLQSASVVKQVNQLEVYEQFVDHEVVERTSTPSNTFTVQDISALLRPAP